MKILNLYAGIGGNRKLWGDEHDITAVEIDPKIAEIYKSFFPNDEVIVGDAHQYLLEHYNEFEFIWSSPPCPTHSKVRFANQEQNKPLYPDMTLYQEILFLQGYFKAKWVVENVISWYEPLIRPFVYEKHFYWSNFIIGNKQGGSRGMGKEESLDNMYKLKGFDLSSFDGIDKMKTMRNCVEPSAGLAIFNMAFKEQQRTIL